MSAEINKHACGAGCVFAHNWTGMSTNGGCRCLNSVKDIDDKLRIRFGIFALKNRLLKLENELANKVIEGEIDE